VGVWITPLTRIHRALATLPYIAIATVATFFYSIPLVCAFFGDCL
jgi:hypothetical protein